MNGVAAVDDALIAAVAAKKTPKGGKGVVSPVVRGPPPPPGVVLETPKPTAKLKAHDVRIRFVLLVDGKVRTYVSTVSVLSVNSVGC